MLKKTLIAVLAVLAAALAAAPAGAATVVCPPGVTDATYCAVGNQSGLRTAALTVSAKKTIIIITTIKYKLRCVKSGGCSGKLYLEAATYGHVIYGSRAYSLTNGKTVTLLITLNPAARKALEKTGKLKVTVVSVTGNVRTVIGSLIIKGQRRHRQVPSDTLVARQP